MLEKVNQVVAQASLENAISQADFETVYRAAVAMEYAPEASHKLLHIVTQRPYESTSMALSSFYVTEKLVERFMQVQRERLLSFLRSARGSDTAVLAGLRGSLFEGLAHRLLQAGGRFKVRCLDASAASTEVELPSSTAHPVLSPTDIGAAPAGAYCEPRHPNFPAVDAVLLPRQLFQMTVSPQHEVPHAALVAVLKQLPPAERYDLYFVVPEDQFGNFQAQPFVGADGRVLTRLDARVKCVRQWALCISLGSTGPLPTLQNLTI